MSYPGPGVPSVIHDIETDPLVSKVDTAKFWQAHYGVGMANLRVSVGRGLGGDEGAMVRLRERIVGLIRNRLGGGYGGGVRGQKWEVSVEVSVDEGVDGGHGHGHASGGGGVGYSHAVHHHAHVHTH